jgi:hypothetical protein
VQNPHVALAGLALVPVTRLAELAELLGARRLETTPGELSLELADTVGRLATRRFRLRTLFKRRAVTRSSNSWARVMSAARSSKARTIAGAAVASSRGHTDEAVADSKNLRRSGRGRGDSASAVRCPAATTVARKSTLSTTSSSASDWEK